MGMRCSAECRHILRKATLYELLRSECGWER